MEIAAYCRLGDNINAGHEGLGFDVWDLIEVLQNAAEWRDFGDAVMNFFAP